MKTKSQKMNAVVQNVILGSITGIMVGYNLRLIFMRVGATDIAWILFFVLGPLIGYFSGKERERLDALKQEKVTLKENLYKINSALKRSANKYRLLVEQANDAIFLTTIDGRFLLFNEATSLLTGYRKDELKKMSLSQLQIEEIINDSQRQILLDNRICRYEERWRNKNGDIVFLEINARWIQFLGHQLILHVGRNALYHKEEDYERKELEIKLFQKQKLMESALIHCEIFKKIAVSSNNTIELLHNLHKSYPMEEVRLSTMISEWEKMRRLLNVLEAKNSRDLNSIPSQWNMNEILGQELCYLKTISDLNGLLIKTSFASDLPPIFGLGGDFSLAFGIIFQAILESVKNSGRKELSITTRPINDNILVEVNSTGTKSFEKYLSEVADPILKNNDFNDNEENNIGLLVCKSFFKSFGAMLDIGYQQGKGTLIRVRVPIKHDIQDEFKKEVIETKEETPLIII